MNKHIYLTVFLLIIFFIISMVFSLFFDESLDNFVIYYTSFDNIERKIIENGISLSLSFLTVGIIHKYGLEDFTMEKHPQLEFISIVLGTIIMLILYEFYKKSGFKKIKIVRKDRDLDKDHIVDKSTD